MERDPDEPFSSVSWETTADRHTVPTVMVGSITGALPALMHLILMVTVRKVPYDRPCLTGEEPGMSQGEQPA